MEEPIQIGGHPSGFGANMRKDNWWITPLLTVIVLSGFSIYVFFAAIVGEHYFTISYLSPLYSPILFVDANALGGGSLEQAWFGSWPAWMPSFIPASPALFILIFPGIFRASCYYYRKSYFRSFFGTPAGCAVCPANHKNYKGETGIFSINNLHRYTMYFAVIYIFILAYEAIRAFFHPTTGEIGVGVGSLVLVINVYLLGSYTFGCHSLRHLVGGRKNTYSESSGGKISHFFWKRVTFLNENHQRFAWLSLIFVVLTDLYIRLVSMGVIPDFNTWGISGVNS